MDQEPLSLKDLLDLTPQELQLICKRYILQETREDLKFKIIGHEVKPVSDKVIGFLGDHYSLKVTILPKKVSYEKVYNRRDLSFFVKFLLRNEEYLNELNAFNKEILLYQFLLPRLQDIPIGVGKWAASCFLTRNKKLLIFEDLTAKGYRVCNRTDKILDLDHLEVAIKTIARFHASSIIFEERTNFTIEQHYPGYLTENCYPRDSTTIRGINLETSFDAVLALSLLIPKYKNEEIQEKIKEKLPEILRSLKNFAEPSNKYRNVLNHSDLWCNNIMFKYEPNEKNTNEINSLEIIVECDIEADEDGRVAKLQKSNEAIDETPIDALLCDFQLARYVPPSFDIMSLITITTQSDFRRKYFKHLLNAYKTTLLHEVTRVESNEAEILKQLRLEESCEEYRLAGLVESCIFNGLTLLPNDIAALFCENCDNYVEFVRENKTQLWKQAFESCEMYRSRMTDAICEIIDDYVLV